MCPTTVSPTRTRPVSILLFQSNVPTVAPTAGVKVTSGAASSSTSPLSGNTEPATPKGDASEADAGSIPSGGLSTADAIAAHAEKKEAEAKESEGKLKEEISKI